MKRWTQPIKIKIIHLRDKNSDAWFSLMKSFVKAGTKLGKIKFSDTYPKKFCYIKDTEY